MEKEEHKGWSCGDFCYAAEANIESGIETVFDNHCAGMRDPEYPTWKLPTEQNEVVLFSNKGTVHFIDLITAYSKDGSPVSRTILTFFEQLGW